MNVCTLARTGGILLRSLLVVTLASALACVEPPPEPLEYCASGEDEDGDGLTDCDDPDCARFAACLARPEQCANGVDDDADGATDWADPDCADA